MKMGKILIALLVLLLATTCILSVKAEIPRRKTHAYIVAAPNPVGVNQDVLLIFGLQEYLYQWPDGWENIKITVERPDGKTEELGPFKTDSTGSTGTIYKPTLVGTYYFQVHFPGQNYTWRVRTTRAPTLYGTIYYEPSTSEKYALVVQAEPTPKHPGFPLPTEFWTRPIDSQMREWWIAGNWLFDPPNLYAPYNAGPETPHVLWAKPSLRVLLAPLEEDWQGDIFQTPLG